MQLITKLSFLDAPPSNTLSINQSISSKVWTKSSEDAETDLEQSVDIIGSEYGDFEEPRKGILLETMRLKGVSRPWETCWTCVGLRFHPAEWQAGPE